MTVFLRGSRILSPRTRRFKAERSARLVMTCYTAAWNVAYVSNFYLRERERSRISEAYTSRFFNQVVRPRGSIQRDFSRVLNDKNPV
jgi:hypothetical protein